MPASIPTHLVVVEPDVAVAKAVASLALDVLPAHTEAVVAKTPTEEGARRVIESLAPDPARLIVVCAADLDDAGKGLSVLRFVREHRPSARVLLLTRNERDELARGLVSGADSVLTKPLQLGALRSVLEFLGTDLHATVPPPAPRSDGLAELRNAIAALESALLSVEAASDRVAAAVPDGLDEARRSLQEAELLAAQAHRRALDAEQRLAHQSESRTSY